MLMCAFVPEEASFHGPTLAKIEARVSMFSGCLLVLILVNAISKTLS